MKGPIQRRIGICDDRQETENLCDARDNNQSRYLSDDLRMFAARGPCDRAQDSCRSIRRGGDKVSGWLHWKHIRLPQLWNCYLARTETHARKRTLPSLHTRMTHAAQNTWHTLGRVQRVVRARRQRLRTHLEIIPSDVHRAMQLSHVGLTARSPCQDSREEGNGWRVMRWGGGWWRMGRAEGEGGELCTLFIKQQKRTQSISRAGGGGDGEAGREVETTVKHKMIQRSVRGTPRTPRS